MIMIARMRPSSERVTVSLPSDVREAAAQIAQASGRSFSAVVNEAMSAWLRTRLVDAWLDDYQEEFGAFYEDELVKLANEAGVPYVAPRRTSVA